MISVITVYNNKKIFGDCLAKSLQKQTAKHELIGLDNTMGNFSSAACALNFGARQALAESRYFLFAHQDIELLSPAFLEDVERQLSGLHDLGVAGVAGNSSQANRILSNITHGMSGRSAGTAIQKPVQVMTVDECCAIVPRQVFEKFMFDETVCDSWHTYVVELCLRIRAAGLNVYVIPAALHHASLGTLNRSYFKTLKKVLRAHRKTFPLVYTTCGRWSARAPLFLQRGWLCALALFYAVTNPLAERGFVPKWMQARIDRRHRLRDQRCIMDEGADKPRGGGAHE